MEEEYKQDNGASAPLSGMLEGLLSNPDLLRRVGEIVNAVGNSSSGNASTENSATAPPVTPSSGGENRNTGSENMHTGSESASAPTGTMGSGDGLASLLSNPAMMEQLPRIMAMVKPLLASMPPPPPTSDGGNKSMPDCRDDLLLALKPFLSAQRRDAVDSILRIAKLGILLKQLK